MSRAIFFELASHKNSSLFRMVFLEFYSNLSDVQVSEQCVYNMLYGWLVVLEVGERRCQMIRRWWSFGGV